MKGKAGISIAVTVAVLAILTALDLLFGGGSLSPVGSTLLWKLRFPRALSAILAGASLSLAGAQMQAIFRNPLSDPHIMGVSSASGLGAAIAVTAAGGSAALFYGVPLAVSAFAGAILGSLIILAISRKTENTAVLLIAGVMLGFVFNAVSSLLQYTSSEESLKVYFSWAAGSFEGNRPGELAVMAIALAVGTVLAIINRRGLDVILFGDDYAVLAGANVKRIRTLALTSSCLMTAAVTAFCGPIGFVGIIAPHITRALIGSSVHGRLLPSCLLTGAVIGVAADLLSRIWTVPVPAGSTMALIGIPVILYLLLKK